MSELAIGLVLGTGHLVYAGWHVPFGVEAVGEFSCGIYPSDEAAVIAARTAAASACNCATATNHGGEGWDRHGQPEQHELLLEHPSARSQRLHGAPERRVLELAAHRPRQVSGDTATL